MDDQEKDKIALRIAFIAETKLAIVVTVLLEKLQQDEQNRVDNYCVLEKVLQQDTRDLERGLLNKTITLASNHMRETQEYHDQIFEPISWLLEQYKEDAHVFHITKVRYQSLSHYILLLCVPLSDFHPLLQSLSQLLEVSGEYKIPLPKGKFQAICSALHNQICSQAKPLSTENHAELVHCIVLLARSSPEDLIAFLHSQLKIKNEAVRVTSLNLLRAIADADLPETGDKKCLIVKAVKSTLGDQNATVRKAVLHFTRRLLSSESVENCAAWDMVAHVFMEFIVSTSKLARRVLNT
ncbi:maestro heat-like repeat-containing protein family member 2A [Gopherus flavomarginatus]|uniref:maestro heat-like repeat-containing protein family member 2A n=1 Tax=Gopherus flavomarginatus TaxID=286002 RepID=UPI0021CBF338|nr:maestro heat-like repeat-containing protein family member 2A [Gopherus flavomarginatus]